MTYRELHEWIKGHKDPDHLAEVFIAEKGKLESYTFLGAPLHHKYLLLELWEMAELFTINDLEVTYKWKEVLEWIEALPDLNKEALVLGGWDMLKVKILDEFLIAWEDTVEFEVKEGESVFHVFQEKIGEETALIYVSDDIFARCGLFEEGRNKRNNLFYKYETEKYDWRIFKTDPPREPGTVYAERRGKVKLD